MSPRLRDIQEAQEPMESENHPEKDKGRNPLLENRGLPRFDLIRAEHIEPGIEQLLNEVGLELDGLEKGLRDGARPGWDTIVVPLERLLDRVQFSWGIVEHLMSVKNSDELRKAHEKAEPQVVAFRMRLLQNRILYDGLVSLRESREWPRLDDAQRRIVEKLLQEAKLAGVGLSGERRERFNQIQQELAGLSTRFGNQLLDATKAFALELEDPAEVDGLLPAHLELAAQSARQAGRDAASLKDGPWRITLDGPSYQAFMRHSRRRDLREKLYRASVVRASSGELDNTPLMGQILRLRKEEASLLEYGTFAELSLSRKMARRVGSAEQLLDELREASHSAARNDLADLREFVAQEAPGAPEAEELCHWDVPFWQERLREKRFDVNEEALRPYFPMPRVLSGLFRLARSLFGVEVTAADGETPVWHPDVRFFRVKDLDGQDLAAFYLDPFSRPAEKRGGAWMDECVGRSRALASPGRAGQEEVRLPVAHLVCNGSPPVGGKPSLMTFRDIGTLFHEFGHTLQHMLTRVDYGLAAGIRNIEWDAVELPSQFMENWCFHRETVLSLSSHVETGEPLPEAVFEKIRSTRTFFAGTGMLRQLYYGLIDLELHHRFDPGGTETVFDVERRIAAKATVLPPLPEDRWLCGFGHIFQGAYAAGYYSYKWAEVLSADAFSAFEEAGLDNPEALAATGRRFRDTILSLGGSRHPMDVFKAFRGREPTTEALLRHNDLLSS